MVKEVNKEKWMRMETPLWVNLAFHGRPLIFVATTEPSLASGGPPVQAAGEHDRVCADEQGGGRVPQQPHGVQHPRA